MMTTNLDILKQLSSALYDELRGSDQVEANRLLRKLIYQLEMMDHQAGDVPESTRDLANWLVRVCDVEHGVLVKHYPDQPNETDSHDIDQHVKAQQQQLHAGLMLHSEVERGVKHLAGMLGVTGVQTVAVPNRISWFASALLEHLRADRDMGEKLHLLAQETMQSLQSVQQMLVQLGEKSPELQHVANMLERPIPDDPVQAHDYLKQVSQDLQLVQRKMVATSDAANRDIDQRVQAFETVSDQLSASKQQERSDALTGLPNRRSLIDYLESQPRLGAVTLAIVDMEQLQHINTTAGQASGNRCLCELADLMVDQLRAEDMVFRIGNDKFVLVFPDLDHQHATKASLDLHRQINQLKLTLADQHFSIRTSFGLAERNNMEAPHSWIKRADAALYIARGKGGNCVEVSV